MSKFLSGRQSNLKLGVVGYTENKTVLETTGKVGIGTTDAQQHSLFVVGSTNITGDTTVGSAITMYASTGIISATAFHGDGSNLENTGATLTAASGTQRLVVTSLTSGTMVDAATDSDLTFNATTNTLNTDNLIVAGNLTVSGDQTILNTTQLEVEDINIGIASANPKLNNAQLDGAGITIHGLNGDKTLTWDNSNSRLGFNTDVNVANLKLDDNQKATFGDGDDLQIYHDGSNSYIVEDGAGLLNIDSSYLRFRNVDGSKTFASFTHTTGASGGVQLYYNGSKKFETTSYGVKISNDLNVGTGVTIYGNAGIVSAISFYGDGSNLTNTGATLSPTSGTERLVTTQLTSGTMVDAGTDVDLTFNAGSNTLSTPNLSASGISTDGSTYGNFHQILRARGDGTWEWATVPGIFSVNNILNGIIVREEGNDVGTAGSITTLDFRGVNIFASADPQPNGIATITMSETPTFEQLNVTGISTFGGVISAGSSLGVSGQYLRNTGTGVTWANFPTLRVVGINTASAGDTTFNFNYNVDFLDVFVNGVKLTPSEYTATNGNQIVLKTPAFADEIVEFHSYNTASTYGGGGGGGGGGASNLDGLTDVTINTLGDGQLLQYNNASGQWRNVSAATVVGAASSFATKVSTATTATAGQTVFNGTYTVGFVDVYLNGSKLSEDQYTAASGTNIALNTGASENDIVEVIGLTANVPGGGGGGGYGDSNVNTHLNLSTASTGEVLSWNGSDYDWVVNGTYANSDVDTHLNVSGASNNQILGWNGSDYVWVTNVSGASNLNGLSDVTIASLADNQLLQYNTSTSKWENVDLSSLGLITGVTASTGLSGGGSSGGVSLSLSSSGVTPGTYTNADITVDQYGRVTAAAIGTGGGSGVSIIRDDNTLVGSAGTINFGAGLDVSPVVSGMVTVTSNIVGDITPQLGGDLYLNGKDIRNNSGTVRIRDNGNVTAAGFAGNGGSITGIVTTNIINYGQGFVKTTVTNDLQSQINALGNNLNIVGFYNALDGQITSYTVVGETRSYPTVGQPLPTVGITTGDYFIVGTGGTDVTPATFITSGISSAFPGDWVVGVGTDEWQILSYSQQVVAPRASAADKLETLRDFSISGDVIASVVQFDGTANVGLDAVLSNNFSANTSGVVTATSFGGSGANLTGLTGAAAGTYGSASTVPQIAVDANGRITGISNVNVSGGGSSGISSVGIQSGGQLIGNATSLNFTGDAIETVTFSSGTATINTKASSTRNTGEITTGSMNNGATVTGTVTLPKSGVILSASFVGISSGWLRLYSRADLATADANRTRFTDPLAGSGVLLETIKSGVGTVYLSPQTIFANVEDVVTNDYQYRYTNDGATGITTITFNYLSLEA